MIKKNERGFLFFLILGSDFMWFLSELSPHSLYQLIDQAQVFLHPFIYLGINGGVSVFLKNTHRDKNPNNNDPSFVVGFI